MHEVSLVATNCLLFLMFVAKTSSLISLLVSSLVNHTVGYKLTPSWCLAFGSDS